MVYEICEPAIQGSVHLEAEFVEAVNYWGLLKQATAETSGFYIANI